MNPRIPARLRIRNLLLVTFLLNTALTSAAPPMNDHFANRTNLGTSANVNFSGTNEGATLEVGEDNFSGLSGASVWYEWTAPTSGWVMLRVTGESLDAVAGLFTGSSLGSLTRLGFCDDWRLNGEENGLRLYFNAQAGIPYKICVHGYDDLLPSTGAFGLEIRYEQPAALVSSLAISPASADVSSSSQTLTLTVGLALANAPGPEDFFLSLALLAPEAAPFGNSISHQISFAETDRISGNILNGVYRKTFVMPRYSPGGEWSVSIRARARLVADDPDSGADWTHGHGNDAVGEMVIPPPGSGYPRIPIQNSNPDTVAPVLESFSVSTPSVDVRSESQSVTLTLRATDALSGIGETISIALYPPDNFGYGESYESSATMVAGDANDGTYELEFTVPHGFPGGTAYWHVILTDAVGNSTDYMTRSTSWWTGENPMPPGADSTLAVTGSVGYDAWAFFRHFGYGPEGLLEDANGDGTTNLACYSFDIEPSGEIARVMEPGDTFGLPLVTTVGTGANQRLRIEFVRRVGPPASGLVYRPQFADIPTESGAEGWQDATGAEQVEPLEGDMERVIIEDTVTGATRRFGRVMVEYTPPASP